MLILQTTPSHENARVTNNRNLLPLTSLRFVAAAMIVAHHGLGHNGLPAPIPTLDQGVSFFFVLSGFILTYSYPQLAEWVDVRRFLIYRVARIWPAHVTATVITIAFYPLPIDYKLIANLAMVHAWVPNWPWFFSYNAVSWSISTEFFFYLMFPFLIIGWKRTFWWKLLLAATLLWAMMIVGRDLHLPPAATTDTPSLLGLLYISPLARFLEFVAGMTTCLAFQQARPWLQTIRPWIFTIFEAIMIVFVAWALATHYFGIVLLSVLLITAADYINHASAWPAILPLIFVFAFQRGALSKFLSLKPCVMLGEASYSLYLMHYLGIVFVDRYLGGHGLVGFFGGAVLALGLGFALWWTVEKPARRAIRNFAKPADAEIKIAPAVSDRR